ncbi:MAG: SecDF P1 head subdomain-containing protein [Aggregatilineales bacterium]
MQRVTLIFIILILLIAAPLQAQSQNDTSSDGILITLNAGFDSIDNLNIEETLRVLSGRIEAAGYTGYSIRALDSGEFLIDLPGVVPSDLNDAFLELLVQPGFVEFVDLSDIPSGNLMAMTDTAIITDAQLARNPDIETTETGFLTILTGDNLEMVEPQSESGEGSFDTILALLSGEFTPDTTGQWFVLLEFDDAGATILEAYSSANIGTAMGIVIDGILLSAPTLQSTLSDSVIISGNFSADEAIILAGQLSTGALPVPLNVVRINTYTHYEVSTDTE